MGVVPIKLLLTVPQFKLYTPVLIPLSHHITPKTDSKIVTLASHVGEAMSCPGSSKLNPMQLGAWGLG